MTSEPATPFAGEGTAKGRAVLITAEELATMLSISTRTLWRLLSAGKVIAPLRLGGSTRWRLDEVHRWIEGGCQPPVRKTPK